MLCNQASFQHDLRRYTVIHTFQYNNFIASYRPLPLPEYCEVVTVKYRGMETE